MKPVAIVFARAPRLGAVKRRLAREIGDRAALRFHRQTLEALLRRLAGEKRLRTVLAITPDRSFFHLPPGVERICQGPGGLGQRMERAFRRFPRRSMALVGSDIPALNPADLLIAFQALGRARAVFGPAADGGYWLVGMGPLRPARPFAHVRWSTEDALADTLRNFARHRPILLRTLSDVDNAAALGHAAIDSPGTGGRYSP